MFLHGLQSLKIVTEQADVLWGNYVALLRIAVRPKPACPGQTLSNRVLILVNNLQRNHKLADDTATPSIILMSDEVNLTKA